MKHLKKLIALGTLMAMVSGTVNADYCQTDTGGCGYEECRSAPCIAPCCALGILALVAIIAVIIQNNGSSGHAHSH